MPLLLCPNDNGAMQTVDRAGVQFDICPTCRGVWLDRGELEKLMAANGPQEAPRAPQQPWTGGYEQRREYRDSEDYGYRKKRPSS